MAGVSYRIFRSGINMQQVNDNTHKRRSSGILRERTENDQHKLGRYFIQ